MLPRTTTLNGAPNPLRQQIATTPPPAKTGSGFLMIFAALLIVVLVGRIFDYYLAGYRLPAIICSLALIASLMGGGVPLLRSRVGLPLLGLIGWMCVCTIFSYWPGGSAEHVMYFAFFTFMWLPMAAGPRHMGDVRKLIYVTIACCLTLLVFAVDTVSSETMSRLSLVSGTFENSEDVALLAGFVMPLCLYIAGRFKFAPLRWVLVIVSLLFCVRTVAMAGSRAGILALAAVGVVALVRMNGAKRLLVVVAAAVGMFFIVITVPDHLQKRLATIFDSFDHIPEYRPEGTDEAIESSYQRRTLLKDSITTTLSNPIFGVGPGQFAEYRWNHGKRQGIQKAYLVTHNTYTQVSSENGIPGMLLYIAMLYGIYKTLSRVRALNTGSDPESEDSRFLVSMLELSFVFFLSCAFFMSIAQYVPQFVIAGLALAVERISSLRAAAAPPAPVAPPSPALMAGGPKFTSDMPRRPVPKRFLVDKRV